MRNISRNENLVILTEDPNHIVTVTFNSQGIEREEVYNRTS